MRYLIVCLFVLTGCAARHQGALAWETWEKEGASDEETKAAVRFCRRDTSPGFIGYATGMTVTSYFKECMTGKGFTQKK